MLNYEVAVPTAIGFGTAVACLFRWFRHRERMTALRSGQAHLPAELEARMARLEQGVETIAVEMERVGEGQRFVTRLLAEREVPPREVLPPDVATGRSDRPNRAH